ncbi:putative acetyltransferase [Trypanosoma grayi]|uniref:putative acetyltransferase n=1 Tax=Trypanosoma grayi TaxID=71804 RepID=UPI0004F3FF33|nr:putative acetyltransferase [Trypanosoma grayi]KEG11149.1 putative acetyltransferase [Trypanosoma grayi]
MAHITATGAFAAGVVIVLSATNYFFFAWPAALLLVARLVCRARPAVLVRVFDAWYDSVQQAWMGLVTIVLEGVLRLRVAYTIVSPSKKEDGRTETAAVTAPRQLADILAAPQRGKFKIILLNHRCRADWLMVFPFLARANAARQVRIVLKAELNRFPIFGWSMQLFRYMFLSRRWDKDEEMIQQMISHYHFSGGATIMLFPEGTDLSPSNVERSNAYAAKNGLPLFHHVLNPRSTGFLAIKNMIGAENIEEIIDMTLGYTDFVPGERPTELCIVNGRMPKKVHMLCTRHRLAGSRQHQEEKDAFPADDEGLRAWLNDRFAKKEVLLSQFYSNNPVGFEAHQVRSVLGEDCDVVAYDEDEDATQHPGSTKLARLVAGVGLWRGFVGVLAFWLAPVLYCAFYGGLRLILWCVLCSFTCAWIARKKENLAVWLLQLRREKTGGKQAKQD